MKDLFFLKTSACFRARNSLYFLSFLNFLKLRLSNLTYIHNIGLPQRKRSSCRSSLNQGEMEYLSQTIAQTIDNELMNDEVGYTTEQLMELAGHSISQIIFKEYNPRKFNKILICCGPGNNGGDGLVAARHLKEFGYNVTVIYPKENKKTLFKRLLKLMEHYEIGVLKLTTAEEMLGYDLIVDAIFGFSFKGEPRTPFDALIEMINNCKKPVVSIDVPSGTNIDSGDTTSSLFVHSEMNISLMLPKEGLKNYQKKHYLGGRFIPTSIIKKYNLKVPPFPGDSSYVQL
ncbi:pyridoxal 5'-phosphate synthase, putative [Plasmodium malariae]|uniref:NAD(P)H-hydrate epimerase n=1 Tax=Plasmodium malariae TaxID=5858 RepID=A0A1D3SQ01_PLAMA|nr:pyridoxal 5'-phosphate synthase, putative [Plasmodium malariae]SCO93975.1 pyridoxal 5'-phosphate synthase, putative [Plasmodium malariae]